MSVVTVQLGQCGNQIGGQLFSTIIDDIHAKLSSVHVPPNKNKDYMKEVIDRFFIEKDEKGTSVLQAKAVMVDMEPKAIAQTCVEARRSGTWMYPEKQQFCQKRGSGNNWAHGFCVHGPRVQADIMEMVRREVEKSDRLAGFLSLMSLAGGTGSGVGARITESLRDEFPHSFIVNQVVWPYQTGEVIVQNYNAVLTLSHLYQTSDAVVVLENDSLQKICSQLLNMKKISFRDINKVIAHKLASFLLPATSEDGGYSNSNDLGFLLQHLVPHPEYKLLSLRNIPQIAEKSMEFSVYQWHGLLKHLRQMLIANAAMEEGIDWDVQAGSETPRGTTRYNRSLANTLILRGKDIDTANCAPFSERKLYADWVPADCRLCVMKQPRAFGQYEKSAVLVSNSSSSLGSMDQMVGKAWNMFASRAYVHQYVKHGLTEEDFLNSFVTLEQVIASYKNL
ncbi:tubulin delta chain-like [Gigantopelta aegis]|uniref:tubulin delta chain-like n=1 Tax=Gigantopelta aegis TaxID=1735272 RepID=UPI001B88E428|nr:tubulin delta chain-like [Gigantopelta aegis]